MNIDLDKAFQCAVELQLTQAYGNLCGAGLSTVSVEDGATRVVVKLADGRTFEVARSGHKDWRVVKNEINVLGVTQDNLKIFATKIGHMVRHTERLQHHKVAKHAHKDKSPKHHEHGHKGKKHKH